MVKLRLNGNVVGRTEIGRTQRNFGLFCTVLKYDDLYRVIKKSLCTWWLQYRKLQVMSKVFPASLQTSIDTPNRVQYNTVHIPNAFCDDRV